MTLDPQQLALLEHLAEDAREGDSISFLAQLRSRLSQLPADRRVLIGLIEELVAADSQLAAVAPSIGTLLRSRVAAAGVTATFLGEPTTAPDLEDAFSPDDVLRIGRVHGQAEAAILAEPMFESGRAAAALGSTSRNPREFARSLRARGDALALRIGNRFLFPAFQFNEARRELQPIAAEINRLLGASDDPWGVASFWLTRDSFLDARPADLVGDANRASDLRAAAQRELAAVG